MILVDSRNDHNKLFSAILAVIFMTKLLYIHSYYKVSATSKYE